MVAWAAASSLFAFQPVPKESAKALGVTRSKPFSAGMVFVNGKYIEPPYTVERWGTGIRINSIPVTGQIIDWNEFLKTQPGVKLERKAPAEAAAEAPAAAPEPPAPAPAAPAASSAEETSSLDSLFDDDDSAAKAKTAETKEKPAEAPRPAPVVRKAAPRPSATYVLAGPFKANDASKALLKRVNASRTELDRILRSGGFIFFGNNYSWVSGDKRTLLTMLEKLPELQQNAQSVSAFISGVRSAKLVYLNEVLCEELFKNRLDYRKLKERRERFKMSQKWDQVIEDAVDPVF